MKQRVTTYRKTGISTDDKRAYDRSYYAKFLSVKARGVEDGRARAGRARRDWVCEARRQMVKRARLSRGGIYVDGALTSTWLREQFERQRGRCFYTGIRFSLEERFRGIRNPSLDRIDSRGPYVPGNVVWCLVAVNYAKNDYGVEDFLQLIEDIRRHRPL